MGHEIDLKRYEIRTDLVLETIENTKSNINTSVEEYDGIKVTKVVIDKESSKLINKKIGNYITIEFDDVTDTENRQKVCDVLINEIKDLLIHMNIKEDDEVLIIGLGNKRSTPDSLGPKVVEEVMVTRHLYLIGEEVSRGIRCVSALNPGVMGETGIETSNLVKALVEDIKPGLVIAVDALAASSISRINKSIQLTSAGIHPGSGVGNKRKELSLDTLGVPVIGLGVPTVVDSSTIVYDTIEYLFKHISYIKENQSKNKLIYTRSNYLDKIKDKKLTNEEKKNILGLIGELSDIEKKSLINEVLNSINYNLIVTPKEIDFQIDKLASVISTALNISLHKEKSVK